MSTIYDEYTNLILNMDMFDSLTVADICYYQFFVSINMSILPSPLSSWAIVLWLRLADTHMLLYLHSATDDPLEVLKSSILHTVVSIYHGQAQGHIERRMASAWRRVCLAQNVEGGSQRNSKRQEERSQRREDEP
jgi:hypothetical protein